MNGFGACSAMRCVPPNLVKDDAMTIEQLAKVELHLHLDCSLSYDVVKKLDPSITLQAYRENFIAPAKCTNLADFLTRAPQGITLMQTEHQLKLVVADLFHQLQQDNVLYVEIRFAPLLHTERGLAAHEVVAIVEAATAAAVDATGIEARLILCTLRHFSAHQSLETAQLVEQFRGTRVVALDIAGDEAGFPITTHVAAFRYARERNIPRTAHAGEASGPESVWETLQQLAPSRLGHGVRSIEDPALVEHLRQHNIHLEICPTCNVQIDIYPNYADHPIDRLYRAGISLNVNTDARTITNITLKEEYKRLQRVFGWEREHFLQCNLRALQAAFISDDLRSQLVERLTMENISASQKTRMDL